MPVTTLPGAYSWLGGRLDRRIAQANSLQRDYASQLLVPWRFRFLSESLLANTWLDWNEFVRMVILISCSGGTTRSGIAVPVRLAPLNSTARITYEFSQYGKGEVPKIGKVHSSIVEPTWANPASLIASITGLAPANYAQLQAAFGAGGLPGPARIQLVRNATAHKTPAMRAAAQALKAFYSVTHYLEPIDLIWGSDPSTAGIAIFDWIDDLRTISDLATA